MEDLYGKYLRDSFEQMKKEEKKERIKMEYKEICKTVVKHYGIEKQKEKLIEECAELIVALAKKDITNIAEEMADVTFLIDQITGEDAEISQLAISFQMFKAKRQIERIKKEQ